MVETKTGLTPEEQKWTKAQLITAGVDLLMRRSPNLKMSRAVQIRGRLKGAGAMRPFSKEDAIRFYFSEKQAAGLA